MYTDHFKLTGLPFSLLPDADFLFPSRRHSRAINMLDYGLLTQAGFIVITGEVGAGKTTVLRRFLKNTTPDLMLGVITNPCASFGRLLPWVLQAFDLQAPLPHDDAMLYQIFVQFLLKHYGLGKRVVLVIDEAQNLDAQKLEELRMLSNVNNEKDQLLQIILLGQPELLETLKRNELRQFVQRISIHCHLDTLSPAETAAYIRHRLGIVQGAAHLFDDQACAAVHYFTQGVPRLINLLCDQAMVYAFSEDCESITVQTVTEVAADRAQSGLSAFQPLPSTHRSLCETSVYLDILKEVQKDTQAA